MKYLAMILLLMFSTGCDSGGEAVNSAAIEQLPNAVPVEDDASRSDSFRIRNTEIREEMIDLLEKNNIQHTVNDDNSISYLLADGEYRELQRAPGK